MANYELQQFLDSEFYDALFRCIDKAFPEMEFTEHNGYWLTNKHIGGVPSKKGSKDQTIVKKPYHFCMIDHNGDRRNLLDYATGGDRGRFWETLKRLCDLCNLKLPNFDSGEYSEHQRQQEEQARANELFKAALWNGSEGANKVLAYLRETRKWTDEEIRRGELGYVGEEELKESPFLQGFCNIQAIGTTHRLTIPYRSGSRILGFKFRDIGNNGDGKYLNTKGLPKGTAFFGLPLGVRDLTIVEGELDALHAKAKGYPAIAATAGGAVSQGQIEDAIRKGCKRFTLLFDNDSRGRGFIPSSIKAIEKQGGEAFIAALPEGSKDTDEYLQNHTIEEWQAELDKAASSVEWRYSELSKKSGAKTAKQRADYLAGAKELLSSCRDTDKEEIYRLMRKDEEVFRFNVEDVRQEMNNEATREAERKKKRLVDSEMAKLAACARRGATEEAAAAIKQAAAALEKAEGQVALKQIFAPPDSISEYISGVQEGIPTGIKFGKGSREERLTLNAGLTFVCANRGHGKTSFLLNLAINEATRLISKDIGSSVLFFSYEIDRRRLYADLLGVYVNDAELNRGKNPQDAIISYFKGNKRWISSGQMQGSGISHYDNFERKKDAFFQEYLSSGKLVVVEEPFKVGALLSAIRYFIKTKGKPSLVCIDYAQLLFSESNNRQRTEEIKQIVNDIKDFANKEGIPFVLAAQFNREVNSPASVETRNIGEGGDFERIADTCIGLFNLKELHAIMGQSSADETREAKEILERLEVELKDNRLGPIEGRLYVKLMKRRYGFYPLDTILDWEGRTKHITLNDKDARFDIPEPTEDRSYSDYV